MNNKLLFLVTTILTLLLLLYLRINIFDLKLIPTSELNCPNSTLSLYLNVVLDMSLLIITLVMLKEFVLSHWFSSVVMGLVVAGSLSNILEFLINTCVYDYLNFFNLFAFNFADVLITGGVLTIIASIGIKRVLHKSKTDVDK